MIKSIQLMKMIVRALRELKEILSGRMELGVARAWSFVKYR